MPQVFIATPMHGGGCTGAYCQSLLDLVHVLSASSVSVSFGFTSNEALITRARNALVASFMKSEASYLMFIDADIAFREIDALRMLQADKDVICGLYPKKQINWESVAAAANRGVPPAALASFTATFAALLLDGVRPTVKLDEPAEIRAAGAGFMLIKRCVFEQLGPHCARYRGSSSSPRMDESDDEEIVEYFATEIDPESKALLGEDYEFCRRFRQCGGRVWAAPWCELGHVGTYVFEGRPVAE